MEYLQVRQLVLVLLVLVRQLVPLLLLLLLLLVLLVPLQDPFADLYNFAPMYSNLIVLFLAFDALL
jgi:hypothetical protein